MHDLPARYEAIQNAMWHVGAFLFNWGRLETQIIQSIFTLDPNAGGVRVEPDDAPRTLKAVVNQWFNAYCTRTQAERVAARAFKDSVIDAAKLRNTICHGFSGIETDPPGYTVLCWEMYHQHRMTGQTPPIERFSNIRLTDLCDELGRFATELERLTKVGIDRPRRPRAKAAK